jgi:glucans biosynthesis protein C
MRIDSNIRQVDLDWIRIIATLVVFLYHISMFFNPFPWHVKNNDLNNSYILVFSLLLGTWIMPIFFAISGITTLHALQRRSRKEFLKERFTRLGIPLMFGVFVLTPPQVYIERLTHQQYNGSFFEFFPNYFDGLYLEINGTGNFAFFGLHLWYLLVLLVFSLLIVPLLSKLHVSNRFNFSHYILLPFILVFVAAFIEIVNLGGWGIPYYLVIYLIGYLFFSQNSFKQFIRKNSLLIGFITLLTSIVFIAGFMYGVSGKGSLISLTFTYIKVLNSWNWMLFIFLLGDKYLSAPRKGLKYFSQASMPFYVLHQPIIIGIGFYLYQLSWSTPSKLLFLTFSSFILIMLIYHSIIQKNPLLRILFGIKGSTSKPIQGQHQKVSLK